MHVATIREIKSEIDSFLTWRTHMITRHYSAELQKANQTPTSSKKQASIEFTYSQFPSLLFKRE